MKTKLNIGLTAMLLSLLFVSNSCNLSPRDDRIDLRLDWFLNMSFAGEVLASKEISNNHGVEFNIHPTTENIDPIKMVISGRNNFGVVSADKFLTAIDQGADIVAIAVKNPISPVVFLSKKELNIQTPHDFINKRIGVLPGGSTEFIYRTLLRKHDISALDLIEINIPFDLATFITGRYDVRPAFVYDEPIILQKEGIDVNILNPQDFGVSFIGGIYFTTRRLIDRNPELVQSFVSIMAKSWNVALEDPDYAINVLSEFDRNISFERELLSFKKAMPYFKTEKNQVLLFERENWEVMIRDLFELGILANILDFDEIVDESFINNHLETNRLTKVSGY